MTFSRKYFQFQTETKWGGRWLEWEVSSLCPSPDQARPSNPTLIKTLIDLVSLSLSLGLLTVGAAIKWMKALNVKKLMDFQYYWMKNPFTFNLSFPIRNIGNILSIMKISATQRGLWSFLPKLIYNGWLEVLKNNLILTSKFVLLILY